MLDRLIRAFLVIGGVSAACAWTWSGVFPDGDPVAVLVRYHTPNVYAAVVVWYYVAPGVAMFIAGQFLISTSRIWFARMGGSLGLRSHLPAWPLSPTASLLTAGGELVDHRHIEDKLIEARDRAVKAGHAKKNPDVGKAT